MIPYRDWLDALATVAILLLSLVGIAAVIARGIILALHSA